jgi:protease secretion system outer membrane protein
MSLVRFSSAPVLFFVTNFLVLPELGATNLHETFQRAKATDDTYLGALAEYDSKLELIPRATASLRPNVSFSTSASNNRLEKNDRGVDLPLQNYSSNNKTLSARQALWRPVALIELEKSKLDTLAAYYELLRSENDLALRVASAYMDSLYAIDQINTSERQIEQLKLQVEAAKKAVLQGFGTRVDLQEINSRLEQAEVEKKQHLSFRLQSLEQLKTYAGVSDPKPIQWSEATLLPLNHLREVEYWVQQCILANPQVNVDRKKLEAAEQETKKAMAGHLPTIDIVGQISSSSNENVQFPALSYSITQIGVQLVLPITNGGATQSSVRQSNADLLRAQYVLNATLKNIRLQILREYSNLIDGQARIRANTAAFQAAHQTFVAAEKNLQAGYRTRLDLLNAIQRLTTIERDLNLSYYQTLLAWLKLQLLSGLPADQAVSVVTAN